MIRAQIGVITSIRLHPGASKLELITVRTDYNDQPRVCITQKRKFEVNELCVLIYPESYLPIRGWVLLYKSYLKKVKVIKEGLEYGKVKSINFKGLRSYGIVERISTVCPEGLYMAGAGVADLVMLKLLGEQ